MTVQGAQTKTVRRTVLFIGHVQGVGFRYTAQNIARQYEVQGYVRNLPDGRVEMVAEGAAKELDRFIDDVKQKMGQFIRRADVQDSPGTAEFSDFSIRP